MQFQQYTTDKISAAAAKFEAQKIAFAPLAFQAVRALLELGILQKVSDAGDTGLTRQEAAEQTVLSLYGTGVLLEMALGLRAVRLHPDCTGEDRFVLGKIGWFLLEDDMTRVNFNFVNDVCYQGAFALTESIKTGKPQGLAVFGNQWKTIYEALSSLPEKVRQSWFGFDHFYSDIAFSEALPVVFANKPRRLFDIGGNTAKWAVSCCTGADTDIFVLEPLWDMQRFEASAYSLQAVSLYFTSMANGNSKMYRFGELTKAVEQAGFELKTASFLMRIALCRRNYPVILWGRYPGIIPVHIGENGIPCERLIIPRSIYTVSGSSLNRSRKNTLMFLYPLGLNSSMRKSKRFFLIRLSIYFRKRCILRRYIYV